MSCLAARAAPRKRSPLANPSNLLQFPDLVHTHMQIMTQCHTTAAGLAVDTVSLSPQNVQNNLIWKTGKGGLHYLQNDSCNSHICEADTFYSGLNFTPDDVHENPKIDSWREESAAFLAVDPLSICSIKRIGARFVSSEQYASRSVASINQVMNGKFQAGMYGWWGNVQPNNPTLAGYPVWNPESASWVSVSSTDCQPGQEPCAQIRVTSQPNASVDSIRFKGSSFDVERTQPNVTMHLSFFARGVTDKGAPFNVHGCISFLSYADLSGSFCEVIVLNSTWQHFHITISTNTTWIPMVASAEFVVEGCGTVWLDDVEAWQGGSESPPCISVTPLNIPNSSIWKPGSSVIVAPQPCAVASPLSAVGATALLKWRLLVPSGSVLAQGQREVSVGSESTIALPHSAQGAILLNIVAKTPLGDTLLANATHRLFIGTPASGNLQDGFAFMLTNDWHTRPAYIGSGLLGRRVQTQAGLGFTGNHLYLNTVRMLQVMRDPNDFVSAVLNNSVAAGQTYLFTIDPEDLLKGHITSLPNWTQATRSTAGIMPVTGTWWPPPRPNMTTDAALHMLSDLLTAIVRRWAGPAVRFWEITNEANTYLSASEYLRTLRTMSVSIRHAMPTAAQAQVKIIGGSVVNDFRGPIWNATIIDGSAEFDYFSFHPYRFYRSDPEADCLGLCGHTFRAQVREANNDLRRNNHSVRDAVFLTEEAQGVSMQRTRSIGFGMPAGYDFIMRLQSWSQGEIVYANFVARMYLTAMGERSVGYSNHAGTHLFSNDDLFTPNLPAAAVHTMSVRAGLRSARSLGGFDSEASGFEGYLFATDPAHGGHLVATIWTRDSLFASNHMLAMNLPCSTDVKLFNTFGNSVASTTVPTQGTTNGIQQDELAFGLGRDVVYLRLGACTVRDQHGVFAAITSALTRAFAGSGLNGWPSPFW
eukprot:SAG31_NODE_119_length_23948_cov_9.957105_16_plen_928_part_00